MIARTTWSWLAAGFAGLIAARALGAAGPWSVLLEARDRLGGERDLARSPRPPRRSNGWHLVRGALPAVRRGRDQPLRAGGDPEPGRRLVPVGRGDQLLKGDAPVPLDMRCTPSAASSMSSPRRGGSASASRSTGRRSRISTSLRAVPRPARVSPPVRDYLSAWAGFFFGCDPPSCRPCTPSRGSPALKTAPGRGTRRSRTSSERGRGASSTRSRGRRLRTCGSRPRSRVCEQDGAGVSVTTRAGEVFSGATCVVAVPLNNWRDIEFAPGLSERKRQAASEGHAGHSTKVWALVENAPDHLVGVGWGGGLQLALHGVHPSRGQSSWSASAPGRRCSTCERRRHPPCDRPLHPRRPRAGHRRARLERGRVLARHLDGVPAGSAEPLPLGLPGEREGRLRLRRLRPRARLGRLDGRSRGDRRRGPRRRSRRCSSWQGRIRLGISARCHAPRAWNKCPCSHPHVGCNSSPLRSVPPLGLRHP